MDKAKHFVLHFGFHREPMQITAYICDVVSEMKSLKQVRGVVLHNLEAVQLALSITSEQCVMPVKM
jgi:hypothetical protein